MFRRKTGYRTLTFGVSGLLRFSNLVMYDRETESWWQQAEGKAVVGKLAGRRLELIPSPVLSWRDVKEQRPQAKVLSRETGYNRPYGVNPYVSYDSERFVFSHAPDERLHPKERVAGVDINGDVVAFPFSVLREVGVVNTTVGGVAIAVFYREGTASALDAYYIPRGRDVGSVGVFRREVEGRTLTFARDAGGAFVDRETGTRWNILGEAEEGPLKGRRLEPVVHDKGFWFAWAVFRPDTRIYGVEER